MTSKWSFPECRTVPAPFRARRAHCGQLHWCQRLLRFTSALFLHTPKMRVGWSTATGMLFPSGASRG